MARSRTVLLDTGQLVQVRARDRSSASSGSRAQAARAPPRDRRLGAARTPRPRGTRPRPVAAPPRARGRRRPALHRSPSRRRPARAAHRDARARAPGPSEGRDGSVGVTQMAREEAEAEVRLQRSGSAASAESNAAPAPPRSAWRPLDGALSRGLELALEVRMADPEPESARLPRDLAALLDLQQRVELETRSFRVPGLVHRAREVETNDRGTARDDGCLVVRDGLGAVPRAWSAAA